MKFLLSLLFLGLLASFATAQDESDQLIKSFLMKSEYVHQVFFKLLFAKLEELTGTPVPEPMKFENFTFDHALIFTEGISHTYDPVVHGLSDSKISVDASNETFKANLHLAIPLVNLTGTYDLAVTKTGWGGIIENYFGEGRYDHKFRNVELWVNFTVDNTVDGSRAIVTDVHSELHFSSCELWAENFVGNGVIWTPAIWISQSAKYKVMYEEKAKETDIILSETFSSYFGMMWGMLDVTKADAIQMLIDLGNYIGPQVRA